MCLPNEWTDIAFGINYWISWGLGFPQRSFSWQGKKLNQSSAAEWPLPDHEAESRLDVGVLEGPHLCPSVSSFCPDEAGATTWGRYEESFCFWILWEGSRELRKLWGHLHDLWMFQIRTLRSQGLWLPKVIQVEGWGEKLSLLPFSHMTLSNRCWGSCPGKVVSECLLIDLRSADSPTLTTGKQSCPGGSCLGRYCVSFLPPPRQPPPPTSPSQFQCSKQRLYEYLFDTQPQES